MRLLYISGGSAGHLAPLVAVEKAVKEIDAKAVSSFVCSDKKGDAEYLKGEGVEFTQIPWLKASFDLPIRFMKNTAQSKRILDEFKPDAIFCKGSAVSIPLCKEAHKRGIPIVLHESDAVMGKANRVIARWANIVCMGFQEATGHRPQATGSQRLEARGQRLIYTGNPIRPSILKGSKKEGLKIAGLSGKKPILLVWGGSQGAQVFNEVVRKKQEELLKLCDVIHLTGIGKSGGKKMDGYYATEFAHGDVPHILAAADIALGRAGSGTIAELAALGIATILVPIEGLANNHQVHNAERAKKEGGAVVINQAKLEESLVPVVRSIVTSPTKLARMKEQIQHLGTKDASLRIAEILSECIAQKNASL